MAKINISGFLAKQANQQITLRDTANEYDYLILAFVILKRITQVISIASGYCFFYYSLSDFISGFAGADIISSICSIIMLISIEAIVSYSLVKCFKFSFKRLWSGAAGCGFIASIFFFVSFYVSTQGIYLFKSDNHEVTNNIANNYEELKNTTELDYNNQIESLELSISEIIPPQWSRTLTTEQNRLRARYRDQISNLITVKRDSIASINAAYCAAIAEADNKCSASAEDYYAYVSIILLIELVVNALIVYFNTLIFRDLSKQTDIKEQLANFMNTINSDLNGLVRDTFVTNSKYYLTAMQHYASNTISSNNIITPTANDNKIGFKKVKNIDNMNIDNINENRNNDTNKLNPDAVSSVKTCPLCGNSFASNHHKQIYCSDECRLQAWSNRTGRCINRNGRSYKPVL